ncbi:MAG: cyclodeaminase/cyclohydrolase family protein [Deltaproteobacteria bacterium]|nr:cyclodeaminase/cyclohydrolase family protein [Deltaproteobacteria bacterium]MBW1927962.1 cyclodeaminase/cyclohydrolase family protein [Deltaproteobacteria bacterium]MBW2025976.1 cyclodeaminase/cyclohydrolase family protein [Deltaproteobacteria bacterium]MBW2127064.1 cyclodeaminase/cyclohydrolase family protein [Deltaproteobacteria bacterium]RLB20681.1 MAG: methenyltetrahydrofolate cyclohydrolase [Deltaproteobacteria bacterium]
MDLAELSLKKFLEELASASPTPGGGSVAALAGALGASLCSMVAGLTLGNNKYQHSWKEMESVHKKAHELTLRLTTLADKDRDAYNQVMSAYRLPKEDEGQKDLRHKAIQGALKQAASVPMETLKAVSEMTGLVKALLERGNPNCLTDAGVAALLINSAAKGAAYNVRINLPGISDKAFSARMAEEADNLLTQINNEVERLEKTVEERLGNNN